MVDCDADLFFLFPDAEDADSALVVKDVKVLSLYSADSKILNVE
jgi:hypothetical protein